MTHAREMTLFGLLPIPTRRTAEETADVIGLYVRFASRLESRIRSAHSALRLENPAWAENELSAATKEIADFFR